VKAGREEPKKVVGGLKGKYPKEHEEGSRVNTLAGKRGKKEV